MVRHRKREHLCPTRKVRHHTEVDAKIALMRLSAQQDHQLRPAVTRVYRCPTCQGGHLT